ncbi:MAG: hypothetical protein ACOYOK_02065 [Pseudobdellovibrionaceae bacterium]
MGQTKNKQQEAPLWARTGHKAPVTRREFLASGAIPFAATMLAPHWLQMVFASSAKAQNADCIITSSNLIPFITVNLSGGAGLGSNFLPHDEARQPLKTYSKMGLGDGNVPITREFGNVPFAGAINGNNNDLLSKFLQGVREMAPTATQKTGFVGICVRSRDDSSENPFSIDGLLTKVGLQGTNLPRLGTVDSITGSKQRSAVLPPSAPLVVNNFNDISNSLGYAASLGIALNKNQHGVLANFVQRLNMAQSRKLASVSSGSDMQKVVECAGLKNTQIISGGGAVVDPRTNAGVSSVWNINANTSVNDDALVFASLAFNALQGNCGAVNIDMSGFDYHDNTRTTGDRQDLLAGRTVGRILQTAQVLNKPVFIYVSSDGAVTSPVSDDRRAPWNSDRGIAGMSYMLYFNPAGRPATSDFQIGQFTNDQAADDAFFTGANPEAAACAVFANYLQVNKKLDQFDALAGRFIDKANMAKVLKFA